MTVEIIAHRGWWLTRDQRNTPTALRRALNCGLGIETDLRDHQGQVVISHDPPVHQKAQLPFADLCEMYRDSNSSSCLALNIKSDGLAASLQDILGDYGITNYFAFDMSIPDMLAYLKLGMNCYSRQSEYEQVALIDQCRGIWLDAFNDLWFDQQLIESHLENGKNVVVVSPELHGRAPQRLWKMIASTSSSASRLMLCTDFPVEFESFFGPSGNAA